MATVWSERIHMGSEMAQPGENEQCGMEVPFCNY
jgi:hypothetical protein